PLRIRRSRRYLFGCRWAEGRASSPFSSTPSLSRLSALVVGEAPDELAASAALILHRARRRPHVPARRDRSAGRRDSRQFTTGVEDRISDPLGVRGVRDELPSIDQARESPCALDGPWLCLLQSFQGG